MRAPDGRVVATQRGDVYDVAWSRDGSRVALALENRLLLVRDTVRRLREARRGPVRLAVATELDRWLRAAGFPPTEGTVEIVC